MMTCILCVCVCVVCLVVLCVCFLFGCHFHLSFWHSRLSFVNGLNFSFSFICVSLLLLYFNFSQKSPVPHRFHTSLISVSLSITNVDCVDVRLFTIQTKPRAQRLRTLKNFECSTECCFLFFFAAAAAFHVCGLIYKIFHHIEWQVSEFNPSLAIRRSILKSVKPEQKRQTV